MSGGGGWSLVSSVWVSLSDEEASSSEDVNSSKDWNQLFAHVLEQNWSWSL